MLQSARREIMIIDFHDALFLHIDFYAVKNYYYKH